jgi:molecular chaperone GrpE
MTRRNPYEKFQQRNEAQELEFPDAGGTLEEEQSVKAAEAGEEIPPCPRCLAAEEAAARAVAEAEDTRLRALAEADNLRKRLLREKEEAMRYIASSVLMDILPGLDNLDLALEHAKNSEACKDFFIGVEMTRKLLLESLKKHGLEPVGAPGELFDPAIHEAVSLVDDPGTPDGAVCALLSRGYRLQDRLLRPAKVVVCKKQAEPRNC